jgi:hypothetical protein
MQHLHGLLPCYRERTAEAIMSGCLLCRRRFGSEHGLSVHIGRTHNHAATAKPKLPREILRTVRALRRLERAVKAVRS